MQAKTITCRWEALPIFAQPYSKVNRRRDNLDIAVTTALTPSANVLTVAVEAWRMLCFIKTSFACLKKEIIVPLSNSLVGLHLEYSIPANCLYLKKDKNHIERFQTTNEDSAAHTQQYSYCKSHKISQKGSRQSDRLERLLTNGYIREAFQGS